MGTSRARDQGLDARNAPDAIPLHKTRGYQWKSLFLPEGTVLRTVYLGENYHCLIDGNHIIYEGKCVSPSQFINAVGGVRRNAWALIWLLFPGATEWKAAKSFRAKRATRA